MKLNYGMLGQICIWGGGGCMWVIGIYHLHRRCTVMPDNKHQMLETFYPDPDETTHLQPVLRICRIQRPKRVTTTVENKACQNLAIQLRARWTLL